MDEESAYVIEFHARMSFCPAARRNRFHASSVVGGEEKARRKLRFYYISESVELHKTKKDPLPSV